VLLLLLLLLVARRWLASAAGRGVMLRGGGFVRVPAYGLVLGPLQRRLSHTLGHDVIHEVIMVMMHFVAGGHPATTTSVIRYHPIAPADKRYSNEVKEAAHFQAH